MSAVAPALDFGGPVSTALEADLRDVVRRHGLVVWLDGDARYRSFVERLSEARAAGAIPYEVCAFSGSYLALLLALESHTAGASKPALVLYLPGLNTETVQQTPLLEVYESATNYPKKLETLVADAAAGQVGAGRIAAFVAQPGLTLEAADVWLARCLAESDDSLAGRLRTRGLPGLLDNLLDRRTGTGLLGGPLAGALAEPGGQDALWSHLAAAIGVPVEWRRATLPAQPQAQDLAFAAASWASSVQHVDDLQRPPVNTRLLAATGLPGAVGRDLPVAGESLARATRALLPAHGGRDRAAARRRGAGGPGRGPWPHRHVPVRGGSRAGGGARRAGWGALGRRGGLGGAAGCRPHSVRVLLAARGSHAPVRLAARAQRRPPRAGHPRGGRGARRGAAGSPPQCRRGARLLRRARRRCRPRSPPPRAAPGRLAVPAAPGLRAIARLPRWPAHRLAPLGRRLGQ